MQGLHGAAIDWWDETEYHGTNDMLNAAYSAGFKTFFVDLWDASGPAATSIRNGRLLKRQIAFIVDYWGVDSLNIIAHSKGGLDSGAPQGSRPRMAARSKRKPSMWYSATQ